MGVSGSRLYKFKTYEKTFGLFEDNYLRKKKKLIYVSQ